MIENNIPLAVPFIGDEEKKAVLEVLESGWLAHGEYNKKFEQQFIDYLGVKYAVTMNSCASALEIALISNNIKGEVIIPSFTFVATANAVVVAGAKPVFCDVDIETRNVTAGHIEKCITDRTEAVMVVHFAGQPCKMDDIKSLCEKKNLLLIEDSAETLGATWRGKQAGSFGIGCFSFFPTKNIATGEGGMFTTNDEKVAATAKALIGHGISSTTLSRETSPKQWHRSAICAGHNYRMSNILAAIGYCQFNKLEDMNQKRVQLAKYYDTQLNQLGLDIKTPVVVAGATHVYQMYTVRVPVEKRDGLVNLLRENGVGASVHFDPPVHIQEFYADNYPEAFPLPNTELLSNSLITMPMHPSMTKGDIDYIVEVIEGNWSKC